MEDHLKQDLFKILDSYPKAASLLVQKIEAGTISGGSYNQTDDINTPCCIFGVVALAYSRSGSELAREYKRSEFMNSLEYLLFSTIHIGSTHENNQTLEWLRNSTLEWLDTKKIQ